ncbi:rRNA maturation RNase YbeY [bacterium]|nr:rRNA maturation RNase YbeY [bacterium]
MSATVQCKEGALPLTSAEVQQLWLTTIAEREHADDPVTVRCVSEQEMVELNTTYRKQAKPTNVLTFSYDQEHDVALCLAVAIREASDRGVELRDYVALLVVHAFVHATGLDHEQSTGDAVEVAATEKNILTAAGYNAIAL